MIYIYIYTDGCRSSCRYTFLTGIFHDSEMKEMFVKKHFQYLYFVQSNMCVLRHSMFQREKLNKASQHSKDTVVNYASMVHVVSSIIVAEFPSFLSPRSDNCSNDALIVFEKGWNCFAAMDWNPLNLDFFSLQAVFVMAKIGCHRDVSTMSQ